MTTTIARTTAEAAQLRDDPLRFGVGARVTVSVMSDRYVEVILGALAATDTTGLVVDAGDVSTYLGGSEADLLRAITQLTASVADSGHHASVSVHLSRGCPGEAVCELPGGAGPRGVETAPGEATGRWTAAEWALYPLADNADADHMAGIHAAIDFAKGNGTFRGSEHFVTRLEGDVGDVLATAFAGWTLVGGDVQHVTSHLTLSLNSPSHEGARR
ncbi:MAG: YkoF family thiamine/hydroxymethylpyrimidine-binding protein [Microbacteriaceae bacterium]